MKRKTKKILILIISIFIFIASAEFIYNAYVNIKNKIEISREQKNANLPPVVQKDNTFISINNAINNFYNLISKDDYQRAYALLMPEFRTIYFPTAQHFVNFCTLNFKDKNQKKISFYYTTQIDPNTYTCKVNIATMPVMDEPGKIIFQDYFTVHFLPNGTYQIAFKKFINSTEVNYGALSGKTIIKLSKIIRYINAYSFQIKIFNGEKAPITILDSSLSKAKYNVLLENTNPSNRKAYKDTIYSMSPVFNVKNYTIPSGTTKEYIFSYNVLYSNQINRILLNHIKVGKEIREAKIEIK